jgi:integration host factor subunit beta
VLYWGRKKIRSLHPCFLYLKADEDLTIPGFGRFYVHKRPARIGRDPKRNIKMQIAAKSVPMFKAGDTLKLHVNSWLKQE